MAQALDVASVAPFDVNGDPAHVGQSWKRWLRSFELYAKGKGITDKGQKSALLLHCGGLTVQDIYFTLERVEDDDEYISVVNTLNRHFETKVNVPYERYTFRTMTQEESETVEQFITRLRQQCVLCQFDKPDEEIRDHVIEKCKSQKLRVKLLERGHDLTLNQLRTIAKTMEMSETQARQMGGQMSAANSVNQVSHKNSGTKPKVKKQNTKSVCFRCGQTGHFSKDPKCPARDKFCTKCGFKGHFAGRCKTKRESTKSGTMGVNSVESDNEFAFSVNTVSSDTIKVLIGGNSVDMIVDSGSSVNIIDKEQWEQLKQNRIKCKSTKTDKKLYAYGCDKPLCLLGKFTTNVAVGNGSSLETDIYVLSGKGPALLGKPTAEKLGVLQLVKFVDSNVNMLEKYPDRFTGVGKLANYKLKLHIDDSVKPVAQCMYRVPFSLQEKVKSKLNELEAQDIIEPVNDPTSWVSPVIVVPKPNGDIRLCVDMRQANQAIRRERHPIPTVEEVLYKLNGSEVFSKLDLNYGYHQIELDESSRDITTFVTNKGLYRYKRLMFGISSAPEKYQQVLSQVLQGCDGVENLSDDIIVHGGNDVEHNSRLNAIMLRLREKNLTLNRDKCQFGMNKITFMGHVLSKHGIGPTTERVKAVVEAQQPKSASDVRSFLGLVNFSGRYIQDLATISEPLRKLTKKSANFIWGAEQQDSFDKLKQCLAKAETLAYYRLNADRTMLVTDASNVGLGAVLLQEYKGDVKVVSYASRTLSDVEKRYSTVEKEALAVVWACDKFHIYLYGVDFDLITDHKPLEALYGVKSRPSGRIERWLLKLMPYKFKIKYQPGKQNIADPLSRLVKMCNKSEWSKLEKQAEDYIKFVAREATPNAVTTREVEEASRVDPELIAVRRCIAESTWDKTCVNYVHIKDELSKTGYIVLRGTRLVIPKCLQLKCVQLAHQGHLGIVSTKQRLRSKVWWPGMDKDVEKYVKSCHGCQIVSAMPHPEPLSPTPLPTGPWQDIAIDLLGPLPTGHSVLVVVDYYSRYYEIVVTKDTTSEKMIDSLQDIFCRYGLPLSVTSDNGPQFRSEIFEKFLRSNGIKHRLVTPLHPSGNGEVERQNRSLMKRIRIAQAESKDWKSEIRTYMFSYRTTPHSVTGVPPSELMFNRKLRTKLPQLETETNTLDEHVRDRDGLLKHKNKVYIDCKRDAKESKLEPGDTVLVKQSYENKMSTPFQNVPYKLVEKHGNSCTVESPDGVQYKRNSTHVKKYKEPITVSNQSPSETDVNVNEHGCNDENGQDQVEARPQRVHKLPQRFDDYVME